MVLIGYKTGIDLNQFRLDKAGENDCFLLPPVMGQFKLKH